MRVVHDHTSITQEFAVSGRIAERITSQINEGHSIRPNQVKDEETAFTTALIALIVAAIRVCIFIRFDEIEEEVPDGEEPSHKCSTNNTPHVLAEEKLEGIEKPFIFIEVPVDGLPRNTEIDYIMKQVHASLMKDNPQIACMMSSTLMMIGITPSDS